MLSIVQLRARRISRFADGALSLTVTVMSPFPQKVNEMNSHYVVAISAEATELISVSGTLPQSNKAKQASPYASFLQGPAAALASNVSDRADVTFAAILGYN